MATLQAVQHYQRSIEKNPSDLARLLHCVGKLYKLPITVDHLQETGIGRTVNALRKHNGELGVAAEAVVNKWKEIVASENDKRANDQSSSEDDHENDNVDENDDAERNQKLQNAQSTEQSSQKHEKLKDKHVRETSTTKSHSPSNHERHDRHKSDTKEKDRNTSKDKHRKHHESKRDESSNSSKEKKDKSESSKHKRRRDDEKCGDEPVSTEDKERKEHKHKSSKETDKRSSDKSKHHHKSSSGKHKTHDKHNENKEKEKTKSKSHSHSEKKVVTADITPPQPATTSSTSTTEVATSSKSSSKRRHEEAVQSDKSPKKLKTHKNSESKHNNKQPTENNETAEPDDDGIDSSMGANFADVLGMLNMPQKRAKKSLSALKQTSPTSSKKTNGENSTPKTNTTSKLNNERDFNGPSTSSQVNLEKKPSLLNSNVKLAPLDPSIALELPVISNNYKPMPLNPTVMDCVFNSSTSSSSRAPPRLFSDAEALSHGISSKTIRTKVYSGVKSGQLFQVPSLFDMCIRVLQKNIDALEYTGGVPFDVLRPVLERATPQQLFTFEEYNPYLMEDSDVLWQQHVQRTYRGQKRQEMESWREMFMRCQEEQDRRLSMLAQNIKHSQKVMAEPVRKTQLAFVDTMVKPPRNVMRKQEQYGTKSKLVATPAARVAALSNVTPNAAKTGDVRLRTAAAIKFDPAQAACAPSRPKKAPLMAKTLQFIRGRQRR